MGWARKPFFFFSSLEDPLLPSSFRKWFQAAKPRDPQWNSSPRGRRGLKVSYVTCVGIRRVPGSTSNSTALL